MTAQALTGATAGGRTVITVTGELDLVAVGPAAEELERLLAATVHSLVVDLSGATFMDSAGINLLYVLHAAMRSRGVTVRLVLPGGNPVHRTLELTGASASFPIHASLEEAISAAAADAP